MTPDAIDQILPRPLRGTARSGSFSLSADVAIAHDGASEPVARCLSEALAIPLRQDGRIVLTIDPSLRTGDEGYSLQVRPDRIAISANESRGLAWAAQTLRQLASARDADDARVPRQVPCCEIEDAPRFRWRGLMLDCCRHFMPIDFVFKFIDLLSMHKMNVFHWHLTEDQGWRIEIKKYPKLTEVGAWRNETLVGHALPRRERYDYDGARHGGFYTQDQIRRVVKFAADRGVTVVPEIEMPGHSQAAIAAYPELGNTGEQLEPWTHWGVSPHILNAEESTIRFYQHVLSEVMELFPSTFIHIGGDEAPKDQWKASPRAQARIRELNLRDEHELQSWFVRRMDEFLTANGRRLVGWDEILEGGLAPGATVMSWRGEEGGIAAARAGHDVVMAPQKHVYFDHYQAEDTSREPLAIGGFTPIERVYEYEPIPAALSPDEAQHVMGAQGQIWTEYIPTPAQVEYMAYPRACALAEVLWSPKPSAPRSFSDFRPRLETHLARLTRAGVNLRRLEK